MRFYVYFLRRPDKADPLDPPKNQPFYVGKGSNGRVRDHRKEALSLLHKSGRKSYKIHVIHKLWRQGLDFQEDIFCNNLTHQEAIDLEIEMIRIYGRKDNKTGILTNLTRGGDGIIELSQEARDRIAAKKRGQKHTKETREKMSQAHLGRTFSEEHRKNLSISGIGKHNFLHTDKAKEKIRKEASPGGRCSRLGTKHSGEARKKNSQSHLGQIPWNKGIPQTEEARKRNSESHKGLTSPRKGAILTDETKEKLKIINLGKKRSPESIEKQKQTNLEKKAKAKEALEKPQRIPYL